MDKKRSILNVSVSVTFKILVVLGALFARRLLIKYVGNEVNGLNSLYTSIIGFLAVADLGIGTAISFCMYKPIVEGENEKVSALYGLFRRVYFGVGAVILVVGCALMPFLPYLAKGYGSSGVNIYLTFGLMLVSTVFTYFYSAKTSLINAYKNNYITTTIYSCGMLVQYALQIAVLILTHSFAWYLICAVITTALQWIATEIVARVKHGAIIADKQRVDSETKAAVVKNVKAMFLHKLGGVIVNAVDSLTISAFIGVVVLGKYSNYTTIMTSMTGITTLFFTPLTSVVGHMCVQEDLNSVRRYYNFFYSLNFIIGCVFFLGYFGIIDNLVTICFDSEGSGSLEMAKFVSFAITLNYFIQYIRQATLLFRDATGTFYYDRWKPLCESVCNLALSIGFVYLFRWLFGEDYAIVGIIVATIITNLCICHTVEPYVLFRHAFKTSVKGFYLRNYACIALFTVALVALRFCMVTIENEWLELLVNGCISVAVTIVPCAIVIAFDKDFRHYCGVTLSRIFHRKKSET